MLNKIVEKAKFKPSDLTSSGTFGNYKDTQIEYRGRLAKAYLSETYWQISVFGEEEEGNTTNYGSSSSKGDILTTGPSKQTGVYNIYDIAGNVSEWTEETSLYGGNVATQYRVIRGGSGCNNYVASPIFLRSCKNYDSITNADVGFRVVIYMK